MYPRISYFKVGKTACYHHIITNIPSWITITREEQYTVEKEGGSEVKLWQCHLEAKLECQTDPFFSRYSFSANTTSRLPSLLSNTICWKKRKSCLTGTLTTFFLEFWMSLLPLPHCQSSWRLKSKIITILDIFEYFCYRNAETSTILNFQIYSCYKYLIKVLSSLFLH